MKQSEAKETTLHLSHQIVTKIVDGDGFFAKCSITGNESEFRLLGMDAPEIKRCSKLSQDEKETHIAAELLIHLGIAARRSLASLIPPGTPIMLRQELNNTTDVYGRHLVYAYHPDHPEISINEIMVRDGYAKPYEKMYCALLPELQVLNFEAKRNKQGLYTLTNSF